MIEKPYHPHAAAELQGESRGWWTEIHQLRLARYERGAGRIPGIL